MGVYLRFLVTVRIVVKFRHNQIPVSTVSLLPSVMTRVAASVQLPHRFGYRLVMSIDKALIAAQHRQHRYTFGAEKVRS
jgi:hypothetical protein